MKELPTFKSAQEFLSFLQFIYSNPVPKSQPNLEFLKIYREQWNQNKQLGQDIIGQNIGKIDDPAKYISAAAAAHEWIVSQLWKGINNVLDVELQTQVRNYLAVGLLDNLHVNAMCVRSKQKYYVILLNSGLITFFNKISKIMVAMVAPNSVRYCNRLPAENVTPQIAKEWYNEVTDYYRKTGQPLGPQIHLNQQERLHHAIQLNIMEYFVLCHEIGHYACGHLEEDLFWNESDIFGMLEGHIDNESYQKEHEADIYGYRLLRKCYYLGQLTFQNVPIRNVDDRFLLTSMIAFFDLLYKIGGRGSESHPDSISRAIVIAKEIYGDEVASELKASYGMKIEEIVFLNMFTKPLIPQIKE